MNKPAARGPSLPVCNVFEAGDGYEYKANVEELGWNAIAEWGADGWSLGDWPLSIVFERVDRTDYGSVYSLGVYTEGDTRTEWTYSRLEHNEAISRLAHWYWVNIGGCPHTLPRDFDDVSLRYRVPYTDRNHQLYGTR